MFEQLFANHTFTSTTTVELGAGKKSLARLSTFHPKGAPHMVDPCTVGGKRDLESTG